MRISDWSSDVCSSDLPFREPRGPHRPSPCPAEPGDLGADLSRRAGSGRPCRGAYRGGLGGRMRILFVRSEEHTSELQSLMRISYAVFCLKKKKKKTKQPHATIH